MQAQPDYASTAMRAWLDRRRSGTKRRRIAEGRRAVELLPVDERCDQWRGMTCYFAMIAAWAGEKVLACQQLASAVRAIGPHQLRPTETAAILGSAARRAVL